MKYVFGPVPSRRLGQSLGIDPIPMKTCNWNCIYCQLGRTSPPANRRGVFAPPQELVSEVRAILEAEVTPRIDWLTFVGSGEPTLHSQLGSMIEQLKSATTIPVAVITNGSLLDLADVRRDLRRADLVLPSVDAGSEIVYRKITRAMPELSLERLLAGLAKFRAAYTGRIWTETMLVEGLNTSDQALMDLATALQKIGPDEVHINLPIRPPAEPWVRVPGEDRIARAVEILGQVARVVYPTSETLQLDPGEDVIEAMIGVITRHPMSEDELVSALAQWDAGQVDRALRELAASGRAHAVERQGKRFWSGADARYVDESMSRCHGKPQDSPDHGGQGDGSE